MSLSEEGESEMEIIFTNQFKKLKIKNEKHDFSRPYS